MPLYATGSGREGIVHVIGPELGLTQPGMTIVCGDSHTSTHGAFGALAFGIGTSEVEHVLATQTLPQREAEDDGVRFDGELPRGVDRQGHDPRRDRPGIGIGGGVGHVVEYAGAAIRALSMEGRMTVCNMSIEGGARAGMIAPDDTTFAYLEGRPGAPASGADWERALDDWRALATDDGAAFEREVDDRRRRARAAGHVGDESRRWSCRSTATCRTRRLRRSGRARRRRAGARVHGPAAGHADRGHHASTASSSARAPTRASRTCARRLQSCAGKHVARRVRAMVVPGLGRREAAGGGRRPRRIFTRRRLRVARRGLLDVPGHEPGHPRAGERCASTSNRNFEGRQGRAGARISSARRWPPPPRSPATSSTSATLVGDAA